jgi:DNA-binding NtrC family response regulator
LNSPFASLLAGKRCLIVEDEFLLAMDYERILQSAGAETVLSANSVQRAQELLERHGPVQLALLDVNLNGQSSQPLAAELSDLGVPFVVITGFSGRAHLPAGLEDCLVLEKPFEETALLKAIADALDAGRGAGTQR